MNKLNDTLAFLLGFDAEREPDFVSWLRSVNVVKRRVFDGVLHLTAVEPISGKFYDIYHGNGDDGPFIYVDDVEESEKVLKSLSRVTMPL